MAFRPLLPTTVRWRPLEGDGLEHLTIAPINTAAGAAIRACGTIIGGRGGSPYGVFYRIDCATDWAVLSFSIETTDGRRLALLSDGKGHWQTEDGLALPQFDGCIDIDLYGSPFTNSLPIRRLQLAPDRPVAIQAAYLRLPDLTVEAVAQDYTRLSPTRFRYRGLTSGFTAELTVDAEGLVVDYPPIWRRRSGPIGRPAG